MNETFISSLVASLSPLSAAELYVLKVSLILSPLPPQFAKLANCIPECQAVIGALNAISNIVPPA